MKNDIIKIMGALGEYGVLGGLIKMVKKLEKSLEREMRSQIKRETIMKNQMRAPISYEGNEMLDKIADIEIENYKLSSQYRPSFYAWGDYD
jgi:hypothetical protein